MSVAPNPSEIDLSSRLSQLPVSIDDVRAARERIMGHLRRTPVIESVNLSASSGVPRAQRRDSSSLRSSE